jgi:hypothetical protein
MVMKPVIIIAIAFFLFIPTTAFAPSHPEYVGSEIVCPPKTNNISNSICTDKPKSLSKLLENVKQKIPWMDDIIGWHTRGYVSENELFNAMKYLVRQGILMVQPIQDKTNVVFSSFRVPVGTENSILYTPIGSPVVLITYPLQSDLANPCSENFIADAVGVNGYTGGCFFPENYGGLNMQPTIYVSPHESMEGLIEHEMKHAECYYNEREDCEGHFYPKYLTSD